MDVTRNNFSEALPAFSAALSECNFVSIDLEMTGISHPKDHFHSKEKVDDRFQSLRRTATMFAPIQIGVCTFKEIEQMDGRVEVVAHPFQFNCIPRHIDPMLSPTFEMCTSAMAFLLENNFDFQKSIRDGVPVTTDFAAVEVSRTMFCGLKNDQQPLESSKKGERKSIYDKIEEDAMYVNRRVCPPSFFLHCARMVVLTFVSLCVLVQFCRNEMVSWTGRTGWTRRRGRTSSPCVSLFCEVISTNWREHCQLSATTIGKQYCVFDTYESWLGLC
jgi:hypothetical protein